MANGLPEAVVNPATDLPPGSSVHGVSQDVLNKVVKVQKQTVTGPDGKKYKFSKGISQDRINKYFENKGIKKAQGSDINVGAGAMPADTILKTFQSLPLTVTEYSATGLPSAMGAAGSMILGGKGPQARAGAFLGGFVGEDIRQMIMRPILLGRGRQDMSSQKSLQAMVKEGTKQAVLDYAGEKAGAMFFKTLDKILPKAMVKGGIPLLPSDVAPNGKVMRYVEDLLTNLVPSAKTMQEFIEKQSAAAEKKALTLANGFSKFSGTNEEVGVLLQNTLRKEEQLAMEQLEKFRKTLPKSQQTMKGMTNSPQGKVLVENYIKTFKNALNKAVVSTENPELIAADMLGSKTTAGLENTRRMMELLHEKDPALLGKVQNRVLRNIISDTMSGAKDPTIRVVTDRFSGKSFKASLDSYGEQKLKAIYGEQGYKSIQRFEELVAHVDRTSGGGFGKFYNLIFMLTPLRSGFGANAMSKVMVQAAVINRAAKIITSPEGVRLYEDVIKATVAQAPRATELALKELNKFNERSDAEYEAEQKEANLEFQQEQDKRNAAIRAMH